jgi:hypothetical protein
MSYYRLEMWFDAKEPPAKSGRYKLHWGLAVSASAATGPFVPELKSVVDGKKVVSIPDGPTSSIDFLVFDVTKDTVVRSVNQLSVSFSQGTTPCAPFGNAAALAAGWPGRNGSANSTNPIIYSNPGSSARWGWEWSAGFQPFVTSGDFHFVGSAQITVPGGVSVYVFDPEMDVDSPPGP